MKLVDPSKTWFVVMTFTGEESAAAYELHKLGYDAYCPSKRVEKIHHRSKAVLIKTKPLMPGYLFAAQPRRIGDRDVIDFDAMQKRPEKHESKKLFRGVLRAKKDDVFVPVPGKMVEAFQIAEMDMAFDDTEAAKKHRGETEKARLEELGKRFPVGATVFAEGIFENLPGVITKHLKSGRVKIDYNSITVEADMETLKPAA
jgi:hypothetical protein